MESFVSLGRFHLPIYGLFAAAGLMSAMALSLRTARLARVDRDALWDLGVVMIVAAFLLSRLMLILENPRLFFAYPLAIFELPALSAGGVLLTLVVALWYLRRRELPFVGALDAEAPSIALLAAFIKTGEFAGGGREGMPTDVPWAVGSSFGRVHAIELYMAAGWLATTIILLAILRRGPQRGETIAWGIILCGLVNAVTDFFHLPNQLYGTEAMDRIEWRGIELIVFGSLLLAWRWARPARAAESGVHDAV